MSEQAPERIKLHYHFEGTISEGLQEDILTRVHDKIENMKESYFKRVLKKEDAEISITIHFKKNADEKYEGKFHFNLDGEDFHYHNDKPFVEPYDVVSHAFKHLKEYMADSKD